MEEEQTTQWPKEKGQEDKQRSTKHTHKTKDRVTRTPLKTGGELMCSISGTRRYLYCFPCFSMSASRFYGLVGYRYNNNTVCTFVNNSFIVRYSTKVYQTEPTNYNVLPLDGFGSVFTIFASIYLQLDLLTPPASEI